MRNYEATRGKIKNYLTALKERYSTTEWKEFTPAEIAKEFGVSVTLPLLLKKGGYLFQENKKMMLSQKINNIDEIQAHTKVLDYCNDSKHRISVRNAKKKEKAKIKAEKLKKKKEAEEQKRQIEMLKQRKSQNAIPSVSDDLVTIHVPYDTYKILDTISANMTISISELIGFTVKEINNFAHNEEIITLFTNKLIDEPLVEKSFLRAFDAFYDKADAPPPQISFAELKERLRKDPKYSSYFNTQAKKTAGRPSKTQISSSETLSENPAYLEALRNAPASPEYQNPMSAIVNKEKDYRQSISNSSAEIDLLQSKLKSLDTIMNLYTTGVINKEELDNLKKGIINK